MSELSTSTPRKQKFRPYRLYSEAEARSARRKRSAFIALILGVLSFAAAGYAYIYYNSFFERAVEARVATQSTPLAAKVNGKVTKVFVKETQAVKAGDALLQIDPKEFQATLDQRQAELDRNEDRLAGARASLERQQKALAEGGAAAQEKYAGGRAWYLRLQTKTQELREKTAEAKAQLAATMITAPADGHIAQKTVDVGATVNEGQPLLQFVGMAQPWLNANFKEIQLEKMKVGQRAEISVAGIDKALMGRVDTISRMPDFSVAKTPLEKAMARFTKGGPLVHVKLSFDAKSLTSEANRMVNDSPADVKVYIK